MSQYSGQLAPISVDAVMKVIDPSSATNVDLRDVRLIKKLGLVILMLGFPLWLTDGDLVWIWLQGNGGGH